MVLSMWINIARSRSKKSITILYNKTAVKFNPRYMPAIVHAVSIDNYAHDDNQAQVYINPNELKRDN